MFGEKTSPHTPPFTVKQREQWTRLLDAYPEFLTTKTVMLSTSALGKIFGCRSSSVYTHLPYISRGLGNRWHFQRMIRDARNRFFTAKPLDLRNMTGGRQQGCYKEGGLKGNAIFLRVSLV